MKNSIVILLFVLISDLSFADGKCWNRNDCNNTWNTEWQYRARARVWCFGVPTIQNDYDCPYLWSGNGVADAYAENNNAWQRSRNELGAWAFSGIVHSRKRFCSRGSEYSDLFSLSANYFDFEKNDSSIEKSEIETSKTIFNEKNVLIKNINGYLSTKGEGMFSSFEVIMWLPENSNDTTRSDSKTFYHGKVELRSGKLSISGDFNKDDFVLREAADGTLIVSLNNLSIKANLPHEINGKSDLIEVVGISDGGHDENYVIESVSNTKHTFSASPNPTTDIVTLLLKKKIDIAEVSSFDVDVYEVTGSKTNIETMKFLNENSARIKINLKDHGLRKGIYLIAIRSEDFFTTIKIILN